MNKKILIIIIAVLALLLAAGVIFVVAESQGIDSAAQKPTEPGVTDPAATDPAATEPGATDPAATDPAVTEPGATDPAATDPTVPVDINTEPTKDPDIPDFEGVEDVEVPSSSDGGVSYLDYHSMTAEQQKAFINSFGSYDAFFAWHDAAKQAYLDSLVEIDPGETLDGNDLVGGN